MTRSLRRMNRRLDRRLQRLSPREWWLLVAVLVGAILLFGYKVAVKPERLAKQSLSAEIKKVASRLSAVDSNTAPPVDVMTAAGVRNRLSQLRTENHRLAQRMSERLDEVILPADMPALLQVLLASRDSVDISQWRSAGNEVVMEPAVAAALSPHWDKGIYRHRFQLEVSTSYPALLALLLEIESLPWGLHLSLLDYQVAEYPQADVTLELEALIAGEEWLGV